MAEVVRYVDTNSTPGGNGTTTSTVGTDPNRAYASLFDWEVAEQTDLVAAGDTHRVVCSGGDDTTEVVVTGWTTGPANFITIESSDDYGGLPDSPGYTLKASVFFAAVLTISEEHTRVRNFRVENTRTSGTNVWGIRPNSGSNYQFDGVICRGNTAAFYACRGVYRNCLAWGNAISHYTTQSFVDSTFINCVSGGGANNGFNANATNSDLVLINCLSAFNTNDYAGANWDAASTNNGSSDGTQPGLNPISPALVNGDFVDVAGLDFHLSAGATPIGQGIGPGALASVPLVDIDGDPRSGPTTDAGFDQLAAGPAGVDADGDISSTLPILSANSSVVVEHDASSQIGLNLITLGSNVRIEHTVFGGINTAPINHVASIIKQTDVDSNLEIGPLITNAASFSERNVLGDINTPTVTLSGTLNTEQQVNSSISLSNIDLVGLFGSTRTVNATFTVSTVQLSSSSDITRSATAELTTTNINLNANTQSSKLVFSNQFLPNISLLGNISTDRAINGSLIIPNIAVDSVTLMTRLVSGDVIIPQAALSSTADATKVLMGALDLQALELNAATQTAGTVFGIMQVAPVSLNSSLSVARLISGDITTPRIDLIASTQSIRDVEAALDLDTVQIQAESGSTSIASGIVDLPQITVDSNGDIVRAVFGDVTMPVVDLTADSQAAKTLSADLELFLINVGAGVLFAVDQGLMHAFCLNAILDENTEVKAIIEGAFDLPAIIEDC